MRYAKCNQAVGITVLLRVAISFLEKGPGQWKPHQIGNFDGTIRLNQGCNSVVTEKH